MVQELRLRGQPDPAAILAAIGWFTRNGAHGVKRDEVTEAESIELSRYQKQTGVSRSQQGEMK